MEKNLLQDLLGHEGLIPSVFEKKVFTSSFLEKIQQAPIFESWRLIAAKFSKIITSSITEGSVEENIEILRSLVSSKYIYWEIVEVEEKNKYVASVMATSTKGMQEKAMREFKYKPSDRPILTAVMPNSFKKQTGNYTTRSNGTPFRFEFIGSTLGNILFYNSLMTFIPKNQERCNYVFLKTLAQMETIEKRCLRGSEIVKAYVDDLNEQFEGYLDPVTIYTGEEKQSGLCCVLKDDILDVYGIDPNLFVAQSFKYQGLQMRFLINLLLDMHQLSESVAVFVDDALEVERTYAASYQLKKNIPLLTLKEMQQSKLNDYFEQIEIDEQMDLEKFKEIEEEYLKYAHLFPTSKSPSLRFRRLGKHKASGLYFSGKKAICIDIKQSNSVIHELLHWLDYNYAQLQGNENLSGFHSLISRTNNTFWLLSKKYIEALDRYVDNLPSNAPLKKAYYGTSKYNRRYYTNASEIFARLGELYFESKYGSSILWDATGFPYIKDNDLIVSCTAFFDRLFESIAVISSETIPVNAIPETKCSKKISTPKKLDHQESLVPYQLSLF